MSFRRPSANAVTLFVCVAFLMALLVALFFVERADTRTEVRGAAGTLTEEIQDLRAIESRAACQNDL